MHDIKAYRKEYYRNHKTELDEYHKQWWEKHPEHNIKYSRKRRAEHPLSPIWTDMKQRCFNRNNSKYSRYGGRGITVCNEWLDFKSFEEWGIKSGYEKGLTIDRIDSNGNYEPSNCWFLPRDIHGSKDGHKCFIRKGFVTWV